MGKKKDGHWTGIASEHLVLSMLYRLGAKAYLTLGNEKSIDIRITKDDGSWISVDVKSVRKWDSIPVGNAVGKDNHYYVFVIYNNKFSDLSVFPEFYIVPSDIVVERRKEFNGGPIDILQIIRINGIFWVILWEMMNFLQKKVMRNNSECRSCVVLVHVVWQIKGVYA